MNELVAEVIVLDLPSSQLVAKWMLRPYAQRIICLRKSENALDLGLCGLVVFRRLPNKSGGIALPVLLRAKTGIGQLLLWPPDRLAPLKHGIGSSREPGKCTPIPVRHGL